MRVLLADFGLAQVKNETTTKTKEAAMTIRWTAPEIFDGKRYSKECDVYSFGVFLWGMQLFLAVLLNLCVVELLTRQVSAFVCLPSSRAVSIRRRTGCGCDESGRQRTAARAACGRAG